MNPALYSSESSEWSTPQRFFDYLNREFEFTLDTCASSSNAKCARYLHDDGLATDWGENRCWMNPPYGRSITAWLRKAWRASQNGALVVALVPARTDTDWWHRYVMRSAEIRFVKGRLQFGNEKDAPFPSAIVVFRPYWDSDRCAQVSGLEAPA